MKVFKPNTDCEVELSVFANGQKCPEFALPDAEDDPAAAVCYIPIEDDDTITIQGTFSGSVLYGRIDVLADDAFVADRLIEGPNSKDGILTEFVNRRVDIKTFLHVPDVGDHKHNRRPNVVEGNLFTKRLPAALQASQLDGGDEATGIGVGSLTVIISLNQSVFETYGPPEKKAAYESFSLGTWRDRVAQVKSSDIKPKHELDVDVFSESNPVKDKRATLFWRDLGAPRPGECPWAYLIFYYRTQAAIDAAGCVPLTDTKILPCDKGTFMRASDQLVMPQQENDSPLPSPTPAAKAAPIAPKSPPPPAPKKAMGLGQPLLLHSGQGLLQQSSGSVKEGNEMALDNAVSDKAKKPIEGTRTQAGVTMPPAQQATSQRSIPAAQAPISTQPRSSFSSPLFSGSLGTIQSPSANFANRSVDQGVDDLATPSILAGRPPPPLKPKRTKSAPSQPPAKPPARPAAPTKPSSPTPPPKRPFSPLDQRTPASVPSSGSESPSAAKRPRLEELAARKAAMEAVLQAKHDKAVSAQKKIAEAKRLREEQQRQWEEEEEEQRKAAMEEEQMRMEEEAMEAEMEALRQQAEAADEMVARLEENEENERREFERMIRARKGRI